MVGVDINTLTMEQYLALAWENQALGVVKPEIGGNGSIPRMTPAQALTAIQIMADHSQMWHDVILSRSIGNNSNTNRLAAIVSKLDNLGRDIKKLKENVHAIQVGSRICEGPHLNKEYSLNEKVKKIEEVKYREFGRSAPFNKSNEAKFCISSPGDTNGALSSSTKQCKVVGADHETPTNPISSSMLNNLHGISFLSDFDFQVAQKEDEKTIEVLQCQLPPKELNTMSFTLPCTIGNFNFYVIADLGASVNVMPRSIYEYLRLANLRNTKMIVEMVDMTKKVGMNDMPNGAMLVPLQKPHLKILANLDPETIPLGNGH
nr:hypothetical protein [Tanacetum cinerariifolium]